MILFEAEARQFYKIDVRKIDITGQRFGRLVAIELSPRRGRDRDWRFICDCGNEKIARQAHVIAGKIASCGCYQQESRIAVNTKHGGRRTRLYNIWKGMRRRCVDPTRNAFHRYGGRGISVDPRWSSFAPFRDWALANGYRAELTIDRRDNDGHYSPENCRWATWTEQANNRS